MVDKANLRAEQTGKVKQVLGTTSDITARKQVEEALRQQVDREQIMAAISQRIRQSLNLENILSTIVALANCYGNYMQGKVYVLADREIIFSVECNNFL